MYANESVLNDIATIHRMEYDCSPDIIVSAPGVIRFLGEQTVDADGSYLAMPVDMRIAVAISGRKDSSLRCFASNLNERKRTNMANLKFKREDRWANLIKSAFTSCLGQTGSTRGFNITIRGVIPQGLGLGSSQALLCAAIVAAREICGGGTSPEEVQKIAQEIDAIYFEKATAVSEYTGVVQARSGSMLYVDARKSWVEPVPLPFGDALVVLTDSRVPRLPVDSELLARLNDWKRTVELVGKKSPKLKELALEDLEECMGKIPESVRRHCIFIIEELQRVKEAKDVAIARDLPSFSRILNKSQTGLRNNFEISCPEIDWLVKRSLEIDGVYASRMIGRGFGGCTVTIMKPSAWEEYQKRLEEYERIFGFKASSWETACGSGIEVHTPESPYEAAPGSRA